MSRSRRKTPIVAHTNCSSERQDKTIWHQRWRTHERVAMATLTAEGLDAHSPISAHQVSNVWSMGKDDRSYWPIVRQQRIAERIAQCVGRNPHERSALKIRLLHKWMSK